MTRLDLSGCSRLTADGIAAALAGQAALADASFKGVNVAANKLLASLAATPRLRRLAVDGVRCAKSEVGATIVQLRGVLSTPDGLDVSTGCARMPHQSRNWTLLCTATEGFTCAACGDSGPCCPACAAGSAACACEATKSTFCSLCLPSVTADLPCAHKVVCPDCAAQCGTCEEPVCSKCAETCEMCDQQFCSRHIDRSIYETPFGEGEGDEGVPLCEVCKPLYLEENEGEEDDFAEYMRDWERRPAKEKAGDLLGGTWSGFQFERHY